LHCTVELNEAIICVEDNGIGIDKDELPTIFDLFTRANPSASPANDELGAGLGLGLALVKELVALHGGSVQVRSPGRNQGSQFTIRLPLAPADENPSAPASSH
jgi:signal transduction histidine kinase